MKARTIAGLALVAGGALLYHHVDAGAPDADAAPLATTTTTTAPAPITPTIDPPTARVATSKVALARAREMRDRAARTAAIPDAPHTTGAVRGMLLDSDGEPLAGVTVIITEDPSGGAPSQAAITDDDGTYAITDLAVDRGYHITYYDGGFERASALPALVAGDDTYVDETFDTADIARANSLDRPAIVVTLDRPMIYADNVDHIELVQDPPAEIQIDKNYIENIPVPGRTFEAALGAAAGSQGDSFGESFVGCANTLENTYYVDGDDTKAAD